MAKIFIDPGHGGTDPGATGNGLREKDLTLTISNKIRNYLTNDYTGHSIRLSRTTDQTLSLTQRTNMANAWGANFLLSVHINAGGGTGYEDFIYNGSTSATTKTYQNVIHAEITKQLDFRNRGKKRANFAMLRQSNMPALLTESGFIDTKSDADKLKSAAYLNRIAKAHADGLAKALGLKKKATASTTPPKKEEGLSVPQAKKLQDQIDQLKRGLANKVDTPNKSNTPDDWAKKDWEEFKANGYTDGSRPKDYLKREEVAIILNKLRNNFLGLINK